VTATGVSSAHLVGARTVAAVVRIAEQAPGSATVVQLPTGALCEYPTSILFLGEDHPTAADDLGDLRAARLAAGLVRDPPRQPVEQQQLIVAQAGDRSE
jgi:hypothetical protein